MTRTHVQSRAVAGPGLLLTLESFEMNSASRRMAAEMRRRGVGPGTKPGEPGAEAGSPSRALNGTDDRPDSAESKKIVGMDARSERREGEGRVTVRQSGTHLRRRCPRRRVQVLLFHRGKEEAEAHARGRTSHKQVLTKGYAFPGSSSSNIGETSITHRLVQTHQNNVQICGRSDTHFPIQPLPQTQKCG